MVAQWAYFDTTLASPRKITASSNVNDYSGKYFGKQSLSRLVHVL